MTQLSVGELVPDNLNVVINENQMIYEEEREVDEDSDSRKVAQMTEDIVDSYTQYIEDIGRGDIDVWTEIDDSDGVVHATVELEFYGDDDAGTIPFAILATEMMAMLAVSDIKMWYTVADGTSPPGTDVVTGSGGIED